MSDQDKKTSLPQRRPAPGNSGSSSSSPKTVRPPAAQPVGATKSQPRPPANLHRAEERQMRREGLRQAAQTAGSGHPRPVVRPSAPPQKVMPKVPAPPRPVVGSRVAANKAAAQKATATQTRPAATAARPAARPAGTPAPKARPSAPAARPAAAPRKAPAKPGGAPLPKAGQKPAAVAPVVAAAAVATLNAAAAHEALATEVQSLQSSLSDLQNRSSFNDIVNDINRLDGEFDRLTDLAESARTKGFCYQNDLETSLYTTASQWQAVRPQLVSTIQQQSLSLQPQLAALSGQVGRLNAMLNNPTAATPLLRGTQSTVNSLLTTTGNTQTQLRSSYEKVSSELANLNTRLTQIHWALDQLAEAKLKLAQGENLVLAVKARWDKEGKDDPEGILYLTDRRLVFERKEKVATKKILFITTASELVHEVLIDQPLANVRQITPENKGLFGHQDYLQVQFADKGLGQVALHIDGQKSTDWAGLVERARGGQLAGERYTTSAGVSAADLTRPIAQADLVLLQGEVNNLQDEMMLQSTRQELSALENEVRTLERQLAEVRAKGYDIEKDLEGEIAILAVQWDRLKANAEATLEYQARQLGEQMTLIQQKLSQLMGMAANLSAARPLYMQTKSAVASAEAQADAARATVEAQYDAYADEVESLSAHLDWVDWMLSALSTASFRLLATECGVAAVEAVFAPLNGERENGILFLTDQRLLWEDRVDTYELKVDVPLAKVLEVRQETETGSGQESLIFHLGAGPVSQACFELSLPVAKDWIEMVGRARSGGYAHDRAATVSAEELERVRNAPQQCSNCGAVFTAPLLRGQAEIHCEYCGLVSRI